MFWCLDDDHRMNYLIVAAQRNDCSFLLLQVTTIRHKNILFMHTCIQIKRDTNFDGSIHMWFIWYVLRWWCWPRWRWQSFDNTGKKSTDWTENFVMNELNGTAKIEQNMMRPYRGSGEGKCRINFCTIQAHKCEFYFFLSMQLKIADVFDLNCTSQITCRKNRPHVSCTCGIRFLLLLLLLTIN